MTTQPTTIDRRDVVLCEPCAANNLHSQPGSLIATDAYSVDGCDICSDKGAGHQVYESACPVYGQEVAR